MDFLRIPCPHLSLGPLSIIVTHLGLFPLFLEPAKLGISLPQHLRRSADPARSVGVSALWMWEGHGGAQHIPSPFLHPEAWFSSPPHLETSLVAEQEHLFSDQLSPCIYFPSFPTAFPFSHSLTRHWLNCPNFCFLERLWTSGLVFIKP